jgi:hypothetical protein
MEQIILIVHFLSIFISSQQSNDRLIREKNEDNLLNQLFWEFILPIPPCDSSIKTMEDNEIYWSDFYSTLQTVDHIIYFNDTLFIPLNSVFKNKDIPPDYQNLLVDLPSNKSLKPRLFCAKIPKIVFNISTISKFKIDTLKTERFFSNKILGVFQFSRIFFNKDYTKACLIVNVRKSNNCNRQYLFCVFRQNDNWGLLPKVVQLD